jgi:hypothetical protein
MADGPINQSGQGSSAERRLRDAGQSSLAQGHAAFFARVRPVRTSSLPVSGGSDSSGPTGRSLRGYGADHAQTPARNGKSSSGVCEKQWVDDRCDRDTRVGRVSKDPEKAWLSRGQRAAHFKFTLTICLIGYTTRSWRRPTVFLCPFGSAPSAAV